MPGILTQPQGLVLPSSGRLVNVACPVNWAHPLNNGRVGWWKVVANPGWRGGNTLRDLVRGGHTPHDGTLSGTTKPTWGGSRRLAGSSGTLKFDGSSSYVAASGPNFASNVAFSVATSCLLLSGAGFYPMAIGQQSISTVVNTFFVGVNIGNYAGFNIYLRSTCQTTNTTSFTTNIWHRCICTYDGNVTVSVYVDGRLLSSAGTVVSVGNNSGIYIGNGDPAGNSYWKGYQDDVSFWNRALSPQEVALDYALSRQGYPGVLNYLGTTIYSFAPAPLTGNIVTNRTMRNILYGPSGTGANADSGPVTPASAQTITFTG